MIQILLILLFAAMHLATDIERWLPVHPSLAVATALWAVPLFVAFLVHGLLSRRAGAAMDKHGQMRAYVIGHGLWHIASALAISQILFNTSIPLTSWATPCAR